MPHLAKLVPALVVVALSAAGCPEESTAPGEARPIAPVEKVSYEIDQSAADAALPPDLDGYEAWAVEWEGQLPMAVRVERYRRGECLARKRYVPEKDGSLVSAEVEVRAAMNGGPVAPGKVVLVDLLGRMAAPGNDGLHLQRDPRGRVSWTYTSQPPVAEGRKPRDLTTTLRYEVDSCTLPNVIQRGRIPAKQIPAGAQ